MLNASEARVQAKNNNSQETKDQLEGVEKSIKKAVNNGEMVCYYYGWLCGKSIERLEENGYRVINKSDQRDGIMFEIRW